MAHQTIHIALLVFALSALSSPAVAQAKSHRDRTTGTPRTESSQAQKRESKWENDSSGSSPVTLATPPPADFMSGEANVAVSGNQNPVIRLGLSPNGATIIEFPASDKLFIIMRPGDGFASPATMANARRAAPHDAGTEARRRSRVEGAEQMIQKNFSKPSIDPREVIEREGVDALAELLAGTGYITQRRALIDLAHALRSRKPLLVEGPRGGGETALAESLAQGGNLTSFYLQGMDDLTMADVLYSWDREAQTQMVRQELAA